MAIAGPRNISVLDSSFRRESHSQVSRQDGDERSPSTRASSLLQMWRELEDEHVLSRVQHRFDEILRQRRTDLLNSSMSSAGASEHHDSEQRGDSEDPGRGRYMGGLQPPGLCETDREHDDPNNSIFDRFDDIGEVQSEKVRKNIQEWMNSSRRERRCNISDMNNNTKIEWVGDTEQQRVRIKKEWVRTTGEQRGTCCETRESQTTEVGSQIGRVIDGLAVNQNGDWTERIRRGNRKLCGRQVLLDMLNRAEKHRRMELQGLMMLRTVSQFAHRNRIQSLLRGRFLRNDRLAEDKRPSTMAASEIGLLRQRQTVSSLRYEFISRLDPSVSGQVSSNHSDTSSNNNIISNSNDQTETNNSHDVIGEFHEPSEPSNQESDSCGSVDGRIILEGNNVEDISWQETYRHAEQWQEQDFDHGERDWLPSASIEFVESDITRQNSDESWQEESSIAWSEDTLQNQEGEHSNPQEATEVLYEQSEPIDWLSSGSVERNDVTRQHSHPREARQVLHEHSEAISDRHTVNWQEFAAQEEQQEEQVVENERADWHGANVEYNEWRNGVGGDMDVNQQERSEYEWSQEWLASENNREAAYTQEAPEVWQEEDNFQEAVQTWLERPSNQQAVPVGRVDTFYIPDDDNANSTELRELLNRRRVSSLLHSGFRESLDLLLQSYVERQSRASIDWDLHGTLSGPSGERDLEQQSRDHNEEETVAAGSTLLALSSPSMLPVQSIWDSDAQNDDWQWHDMHQRFGTERKVINDMRIEMGRLHQRMNSMQKMLEACMDMQLELQRSIQQEVSAALNRSPSSPGVSVEGFPEEGSKLDYVRKGICCMCCDSNIDSLLYRCGHMCTCSKCANGLVQSGEKCPMCPAPVIEVIPAYSIS